MPDSSQHGRAHVTINDVARLAGVSRTTVSKVFNAHPSIPERTARRVRDAAAELKWAPSSSAAALASSTTRNVAMILGRDPDLLLTDPHFAVLISGAESVLAPMEYGLQLYMIGENEDVELETYRNLSKRRQVDGVLMAESRLGDRRYELLAQLGLPGVLMGRPEREDIIPSVHAEVGNSGVAQAARHLVELGHRRIAYVAGPPDRVHTGYRRGGFVEELARLGIGLAHSITTSFTETAAADSAIALMREKDPPTAIVFANDSMAIAATGALQRNGYTVPGDVSIVGYDDLPFGEWIHPRLTTISQDLHQLGRGSALLLLKLLGIHDDPVPDVAPPQLIIRESTGEPRTR